MIEVKTFGLLGDGSEVKSVTLSNGHLTASILDYGARVQSLVYNGVDVVLGYDNAEAYEKCTTYQGAIIGRYANRIDNGVFSLNGAEYNVGINSGDVHLHGGKVGFDRAIWRFATVDGKKPSVSFYLTSPDGDMGYPGRLDVVVKYTLDGDSLAISYEAVSDKDTVVSLTNHCYFNLDGKGDILGHSLWINADMITPMDGRNIPTGEFMKVEGTPFDFKKPKVIGNEIDADDEQIRFGAGYDHNFVINKGIGVRKAAKAYAEKSGIAMECKTDREGMQLYTSNFLGDDDFASKNGKPLFRRQAFCLETQSYPDAPNKPEFPSTVLKAGKTWKSKTVYTFSTFRKI